MFAGYTSAHIPHRMCGEGRAEVSIKGEENRESQNRRKAVLATKKTEVIRETICSLIRRFFIQFVMY